MRTASVIARLLRHHSRAIRFRSELCAVASDNGSIYLHVKCINFTLFIKFISALAKWPNEDALIALIQEYFNDASIDFRCEDGAKSTNLFVCSGLCAKCSMIYPFLDDATVGMTQQVAIYLCANVNPMHFKRAVASEIKWNAWESKEKYNANNTHRRRRLTPHKA